MQQLLRFNKFINLSRIEGLKFLNIGMLVILIEYMQSHKIYKMTDLQKQKNKLTEFFDWYERLNANELMIFSLEIYYLGLIELYADIVQDLYSHYDFANIFGF